MTNVLAGVFVLFLLAGCGGSNFSDNSSNFSAATESNSTASAEEANTTGNTTILLRSVQVQPVSSSEINVGGQINVQVEVDSDGDVSDQGNIFFLLEDKSNANAEAYLLNTSDLTINSGTNIYDFNLTLPNDLSAGGTYQFSAYIDNSNELSIDHEKSIKSFSIENNLSIVANSGEANVKIGEVTLNEQEVPATEEETTADTGDIDATAGTTPSLRATETDSGEYASYTDSDPEAADDAKAADESDVINVQTTSSSVMTIDVGHAGNDIIVNEPYIRFQGTVAVTSFYADNNGSVLKTCLNIGDECEPVEFFDTDESNNTIIKNSFSIAELEASDSSNLALNFNINKEVLKKITIYTFTNQSKIYKTKLKVYFDDTSNGSPNSFELPVSFEPVELQATEVDNVYDAVGEGNNSAGMVFKDLNNSSYSSNPESYLNSASEMIVDANEYNWHDNINTLRSTNLRYTVPASGSSATAYKNSLAKNFSKSINVSKSSKFFGISIKGNADYRYTKIPEFIMGLM